MASRRLGGHLSVFAKLVAIMTILAACLLVLVSAFFWLVVAPDAHALIDREIAHNGLLALFLGAILVVILTAHAFLRHLLRPLRTLGAGVARLAGGELDVELPRATHDEFGELTDAFNHMAGRVREMVGARDRLLIDVSHELRSPLTRMKVALELPADDVQRERLTDDIAEMERMVTELLELERLRSGRGLRTAPEDLVPILREAVAQYRDRPPGVRFVGAAEGLVVDVDQEKVRTVLHNLLENAAKYSMPGSGPIEVAVCRAPGAVVVRVTDEGVGIPEGDTERVFEPFFRVDRSRTKTTGGYGLGLSICKRVMEAHGGSIALERQQGRGTTFVLTFPAAG